MINEKNTIIQILDVNDINHHPLNLEIFYEISQEKRNALKMSIEQNGLLNPITVMAYKNNGRTSYYIVSGHNRLSILREQGISKVPCKIIYPQRQGQDLDILITDNMLQRDLTIIEKAKAIYYMAETLKLSRDEIKNKLGISIRFVQASLQFIRILNTFSKELYQKTIEELKNISGINRALQIVKKIAYGEIKNQKKYSTKTELVTYLREQITEKEKEISNLKRTIKRRDKQINELNLKIDKIKKNI